MTVAKKKEHDIEEHEISDFEPALQQLEEVTEPTFTLRARDKLAPSMVALWASRASSQGSPSAKVEGALKVAEEMELWQAMHGCKVPD
jgi:hypothetical protein